MLHRQHLYIGLKLFHQSQRRHCFHKAVTFHPSLFSLTRSWKPLICFVSVDLPVLDISHEWNHAICDFLCLASFTLRVFEVYLYCSIYQYLIPFNGWILLYCVAIPHVFRHSAVGGHLVASTFWLCEKCPYEPWCTGISLSPCFQFFEWTSRSGIAGSYCNPSFNLLKDCQTVFHRGCTVLLSHPQSTLIPPHPHQHLSFAVLFVFISLVAILEGVVWYLIVTFVCIYLTTKDVEHLYTCLLVICIILCGEMSIENFLNCENWIICPF